MYECNPRIKQYHYPVKRLLYNFGYKFHIHVFLKRHWSKASITRAT